MASIRLYRHPDCAKCAGFARWHRRLDWLGRFEDSTGTPPVGPLRLGEVVVQDLRSGDTLRGAAGFTLLCRQVPAYWPLLPFLRIPALRRRVERELRGCAGPACALAPTSEPGGSHPGGARTPHDSAGSDDRRSPYRPR